MYKKYYVYFISSSDHSKYIIFFPKYYRKKLKLYFYLKIILSKRIKNVIFDYVQKLYKIRKLKWRRKIYFPQRQKYFTFLNILVLPHLNFIFFLYFEKVNIFLPVGQKASCFIFFIILTNKILIQVFFVH